MKDLCFALTIAGSDSGGGAGIQADLRAFHSQGVFGLAVITALTAQNTREVAAVQLTPPAMIRAQFDAVVADFPVGAMKIGMLGNAATTREVTALVLTVNVPLVVDPVMIASSGARLLDVDAEVALRKLIRNATIITPNLPEAAALLGIDESSIEIESAARALLAMGAAAVLLKDGHGSGSTVRDIYCDAHGIIAFEAPRAAFRGHGTGCSLASLITARLALGESTRTAVANAIGVFRTAIAEGYRVGTEQVLVPNPKPRR